MNHYTNKKTYQKPFMEVVELHQDLQMLTGSSGVRTNSRSYGSAVTETWDHFEETSSSTEDLTIYLWVLSNL